MSTDINWDPFDVEIDTNPHPVWKRMRDEAPVYFNEQYGFYALSRHADVETVHRDTKGFSSAHGTVLELMGPNPIGSRQMIFLDPPEHGQLRTLVSRAFTPRRINDLEPEVRRICGELLDAVRDGAGFDYLADFGSLVPSMVISALLGVPESDREEVRHHIDLVFHIEPGVGMINDTSFHDLYERAVLPDPLPIVIEDDVWIGAKASVFPGVRIGRGAVISAHALVQRDVEAFTVVSGVPAVVVARLNPRKFAVDETFA